MKKIVTLTIALLLALTIIVGATSGVKSFQKITLDGKEVSLQGYLIENANYFKLRDLANILNGTCAQFDISYNKEKAQIQIKKSTSYSEAQKGLSALKSEKVNAEMSTQNVLVDGVTHKVYTALIEQNNFVKLRDVAKILGFEVEYNETTKEINLKTTDVPGTCTIH